MSDIDENEQLRIDRIKEWADDAKEFDREDIDIGPGSFSFHEILHSAFLAHDNIERNILEHPSVYHNKDLYDRATKISKELWDFYQECGRLHLPDPEIEEVVE